MSSRLRHLQTPTTSRNRASYLDEQHLDDCTSTACSMPSSTKPRWYDRSGGSCCDSIGPQQSRNDEARSIRSTFNASTYAMCIVHNALENTVTIASRQLAKDPAVHRQVSHHCYAVWTLQFGDNPQSENTAVFLRKIARRMHTHDRTYASESI
jgi:hypothetical protein